MTISLWRYSHLILAVSSFLFLALASITGVILAVDAIDEKLPSYRVAGMDHLTISETLPLLRKAYPEIIQLSVDKNQFVTLDGSDTDGNSVNAYIHPLSGKILGSPVKKTAFILWVTALHRSLFLHEVGRFFVGITALLLVLITISGMILLIKRQHGLRHFFDRIIKENFAQYWHVLLGRLSLIPVLIIAVTGTYLSLVRFGVFHDNKITPHLVPAEHSGRPLKKDPAEFAVFKHVMLSELQSIEFPFADDPEEYYTLKLKDREIGINQFNGEVLFEIRYPFTTMLTNLSLDLHTGQASVLWAVILAFSSFNILFFIYSGFAITIKRRSGRVKNKYKAGESKYVILVGSENGSTFRFAGAFHKQLLSAGLTSYIAQLNDYTIFPKAEHLIIFTATHGLGDAPANAGKFTALLEKHAQDNAVKVSVLGFGSRSYPDFCGYAHRLNKAISMQPWAISFLETYTVNDKSAEEFGSWAKAWSEKSDIPLLVSAAFLNTRPLGLRALTVVEKTEVANTDHIFTVRLRTGRNCRFSSGDLLTIYPNDDAKERFYSIGKINQDVQLIVKHYPDGAGSDYLHRLQVGQRIKARLVTNQAFHFPKKAPIVAMLANGTGIAPYLGMINENNGKVQIHLYGGFKTRTSLAAAHVDELHRALQKGKLASLNVATSQEGMHQRITHMIERDINFFAVLLRSGGVIMVCGSLAMQTDVLNILSRIALDQTGKSVSHYQLNGQILTDCY